ncbi:MAG: type 1 fimbrial protein [Acidovorax sp.]|jgi:major type 1 subunit fimbrin (pilin)|nr:type 1 fimbrial protein [Acidovorax sp.]
MKKSFVSIAILSALFAVGVQAAPAVGAMGVISFEGSITVDACQVTSGGATSSGADMLVSMGPHSAETLGTEANPAMSAGKLSTIAKSIDLNVNCTEGTKVFLSLKPSQVMGKGVAVNGTAQGVQIMLMNGSNVLDFSEKKEVILEASSGSKVQIPLKAYYTLQAGKVVSDAKAGSASALVAYTLSYE